MIITGIITLIVSVLFWCVPFADMLQGASAILIEAAHLRFFFPDSPANAYFLTPRERIIAVERIKVNQAGVENKHFKVEQYVSFSHSLALDSVPRHRYAFGFIVRSKNCAAGKLSLRASGIFGARCMHTSIVHRADIKLHQINRVPQRPQNMALLLHLGYFVSHWSALSSEN